MPDCLADFRNAGLLTDPSTAAAIVGRLQPQYRHHMQGEAILDSNNPNKLVVLTSGSVLVEQRGPDGQYFSVAIRRAPEVIGELEYLTNHTGPGDFRVSGLEQGEAWLVTYPQIRHLPPELKAAFAADLGCIAARKLVESMGRTAVSSAANRKHLNLLRRVVPETGLSYNSAEDRDLNTKHIYRSAVVFFSDVVDFSILSQSLSTKPEKLAAITREFLEAQVNEIMDEGGEIDKFIGDEVMAFWIVSPEELLRQTCSKAFAAARKALEAVKAVKDPETGESLQLQIRVGLHVGGAHLGNYGSQFRSNFSLIGVDVNKAARLEQARGDSLGAIRTSEEFFDKLSEAEKKEVPKVSEILVKKDKLVIHHSGA